MEYEGVTGEVGVGRGVRSEISTRGEPMGEDLEYMSVGEVGVE